MAQFKIVEGSLQERFLNARSKVRLFGGGFGNGKTSSACVLALQLSKDYPKSNGLIARATYPKLNDTIRKEFLKWCPSAWIKSFPMSANSSNTCTLANGTTINFRYVAQQGKNTSEASTSNLLSATYDWIIVDQIDDPEIQYKDFLDLLGRLRGSARYTGSDITMPSSGPRWLLLTCNPTRGWPFKYLVKPLQDLKKGIVNENLLCLKNPDGTVVLENGKPVPMIDLYEGSTYENKENLPEDFLTSLESAYQGQMRQRFLMGEWGAFEGLVYPQFTEDMHVVPHSLMMAKLDELENQHADINFLEGYDYGLAVPMCYLNGFTDLVGNVYVMDGHYEKEMLIDDQCKKIRQLRDEYSIPDDNRVLADPDIFRRKGTTGKLVGKSIASMMQDNKIHCVRGNNDIKNGIVKVQQYLAPIKMHMNPFTHKSFAPHIYFSDKVQFLFDEIENYSWRRDTSGETTEEPTDKNDHAMDTLKYMLSNRPNVTVLPRVRKIGPVGLRKWAETDLPGENRDVRHG